MLKKLLYIGSIIWLFFSCKEEPAYQIRVKLANLEAQNVYAVFEAADAKVVDTVYYDGANELIIKQTQGDFRALTFCFENQQQWITVYLEPHKKITVTGDILYPQLVRVKGGKINESLSDFRKKATTLLKEQTDLSKLIDADTAMVKRYEKATTSRLVNINHELRLQAETFIREHANEEASAILIKAYFSDPDNPLLIDEYLSLLNPDLDDFYVVKELKTFSERAKRTMIGADAPDFNVHNIYGTPYNVHSFAGRYFILVFIAMWNDMCQTDELLLDEVVTSFPNDTLEVMLVSLDENSQEVRNLVRNDSIRWNVVTDSAGQSIELIDLYNVNTTPRCFLIDRDGTIILKTENGIELKQKLRELI
jgi:peroxiredoxin